MSPLTTESFAYSYQRFFPHFYFTVRFVQKFAQEKGYNYEYNMF